MCAKVQRVRERSGKSEEWFNEEENMTADLILYDVKDGIATITMDRPKKKNALIPSMIIDMIDALERARRDHAVRAIVLRGGGGTFCAGDDLHHSYEERFEFGQPDLHTRLRTG